MGGLNLNNLPNKIRHLSIDVIENNKTVIFLSLLISFSRSAYWVAEPLEWADRWLKLCSKSSEINSEFNNNTMKQTELIDISTRRLQSD